MWGLFLIWQMEVPLKARATGGSSVALVLMSSGIQRQMQNPGVAPPTAPYSFTGLKEYAEKSQRCAGHVWVVRSATSIRIVLNDQESTLPS
jgi:hypothetical protein